MELHELTMSHVELSHVNKGRNGRVLAETEAGMPVFIHNPLYEAAGPGSDAVAVPIDDALADKLRDRGHAVYLTPDRAHSFRIRLRD